jgi:hypothetical protein
MHKNGEWYFLDGERRILRTNLEEHFFGVYFKPFFKSETLVEG